MPPHKHGGNFKREKISDYNRFKQGRDYIGLAAFANYIEMKMIGTLMRKQCINVLCSKQRHMNLLMVQKEHLPLAKKVLNQFGYRIGNKWYSGVHFQP